MILNNIVADKNVRVFGLRSLTSLIVALLLAAAANAQEHDHEVTAESAVKPRVFLDKAPAIVAYQLKRLSDAELLLVDREVTDMKYTPVYQAILGRSSIAATERVAALKALAELRDQDKLDALLDVASEIDESSDSLVPLLVVEVAKSGANASRLTALLDETSGVARELLMTGLLTSGAPVKSWLPAGDHATDELLVAIRLVDKVPQAEELRKIVTDAIGDNVETTSLALRALAALEIEPAESFVRATHAFEDPATTPAAIELLLTLPADVLDPARSKAAVELLVERIAAVPVAERIGPATQQLVAAIDKLLPKVEGSAARGFRNRLREITVRVARVEAVYEEMRYDKPFVVVEKGRKVHLELANPDAMPHNWVLCQPEKIRDVAKLAAALSGVADSTGRQYTPDTELVIVSTPAAQSGETVSVDFEAPDQPGKYPYVCTFPGHWMRMYGVLLVVDDIDAWNNDPQPPADPLGSNREFVQNWKYEDFAKISDGELTAAIAAATPEIGAKLFTEATCAACHLVDCEGGKIGPDLTDVFTRWKGDAKGIVRELVDPSHKIDKQYETKTIYTIGGRVITGIVLAEDDSGITIVTNPDAPEPTKIPEDDVDEIETSKVSMMPKGLMDRFTRDEIIEIVGYLKHADDAAKAKQ